MTITVRRATESDIGAMSAVMIASITELCAADHQNDPEIIAGWTANKAPAGVRKMLQDPRATILVAQRDGAIAAVGSINAAAEIGLNYVSPAHRFAGVSRTLLEAMEDALKQRGVTLATLTSTATARRFYKANGWKDAGPPETCFSMTGYPMCKRLARG